MDDDFCNEDYHTGTLKSAVLYTKECIVLYVSVFYSSLLDLCQISLIIFQSLLYTSSLAVIAKLAQCPEQTLLLSGWKNTCTVCTNAESISVHDQR